MNEVLNSIERPFKKYGIPGNTKNISGGVVDYGKRGDDLPPYRDEDDEALSDWRM